MVKGRWLSVLKIQLNRPVIMLPLVEMVFISGLSFLGFGPGPEIPELGKMLRNARMHLYSAPWTLLSPGIMIFWCVSGFYLLGAGMRRYFQIKEEPGW